MNTADFTVIVSDAFGVTLQCPECQDLVNASPNEYEWPIIRTLITAASTHARVQHPVSAPAAIKGA